MLNINREFVNEGRTILIPRISAGPTSREDFNETWLVEIPMGLGVFSTFDGLKQDIRNLIDSGANVKNLSDDLRSYVGSQVAYFWYVDSTENPILITQLDIKPQALVVSMTGKNPKYKGRPPFTTDLYNAILDSTGRSLRLISDISLSDEGYDVWKRLLSHGHKISVYDIENPGQLLKTLKSEEEMDQYFKPNDPGMKRYQYVLSETGNCLNETTTHFNTRRMRELSGSL